MTSTFKKRLLRLEKDFSLQRELVGQEILSEALRGVSDSDLVLLKSFVERDGPFAGATAAERSALERYRALHQTRIRTHSGTPTGPHR